MIRIALCACAALTAGWLSAAEVAKTSEKTSKPAAASTASASATGAKNVSVEKADKSVKAEFALLEIEKNIVKYTNDERARRGLPPLSIDPQLMQSARSHGIWMARYRSLQHTRRGGVAENIAMGYRDSLGVVRGWMNSSGHRANILNGSHRRIGVAAYVTDGGTIYWCQQFSY